MRSISEAQNSNNKNSFKEKLMTALIVTLAIIICIIYNFLPVINLAFLITSISTVREDNQKILAILKHFNNKNIELTESSINIYKKYSSEYQNILRRIKEDNRLGIALKRMFSKEKPESLLATIFEPSELTVAPSPKEEISPIEKDNRPSNNETVKIRPIQRFEEPSKRHDAKSRQRLLQQTEKKYKY